ncbi:tumor susceptibility gene 101 protein-like [Anomaloglossus baeobatrachus]|uniref:tumor susceptibility gene 101 protein-like n=1 Tax=Anomaloglossus baeobatrachus TaxID=238106 RepID=UPI003F4FF6C9
MMAVSVSQLKKTLSKYKYRDLSVPEIMNVIGIYRDLRVLPDHYVFNDGTTRELVTLSGTIPVPYKGNTYNIPICLWLLDSYPYNPPICFVKPTSTMTIKPGKYVDANGKIYLSYLHEWKHPPSDLLGLIQTLIVVFGEMPPVFSRSPESALLSLVAGLPKTAPSVAQDDASASTEVDLYTNPAVTPTDNAPRPEDVNLENQQAIDIYLDCLQKIRQIVDDTETKLLALKVKEL